VANSDVVLLAGIFKLDGGSQTGSQSAGAGAGKVVTSVSFEVYGVGSSSTGSLSGGAGAGKVQLTDLGSVTVSLKDFGHSSYGVFGFEKATSTAYSSYAIAETLGASSPNYAFFKADSGSTISEPNGTLSLLALNL
jgi:hypothetical protein